MTTFHKLEITTNKSFDATLAVSRVYDLHKAVEVLRYRNHKEVMLIGCEECMETGSGNEYFVEYPCPTIKAIEGK